VRHALLASFVAVAAALVHAGCGGGSVCGNGDPESGEECDDGNQRDDDACSNACRQRDTRDAQLIWTMVANEVPGFSESCTGVGAARVKLVVTGPTAVTLDRDCNESQYIQAVLDAGHYSVVGTLVDSAGAALTKGMAKAEFDMPETPSGTPVQVNIDFPFADFLRTDYKGSWIYRFVWDGKTSCASALPPVVTRSVRLERGGTPLADADGVVLDGMTPGDCVDPSSAPSIMGIPWGPADLTVVGFDATGTPQFRETFHTFVGAGISNPILTYDVDSLRPDAGVPDAGAADAAPLPDGP
jgi:cysteine-rich repeat protein